MNLKFSKTKNKSKSKSKSKTKKFIKFLDKAEDFIEDAPVVVPSDVPTVQLTTNDESILALDVRDRLEYDIFKLDYDVMANAETAQGKDTLIMVRDLVTSGKFSFGSINKSNPLMNVANLYRFVYAALISIAFILAITILLLFILFYIMYTIKKEYVYKIRYKLMLNAMVFFFGVLVLIYLLTKFKDAAQTNLEKIVYVL